MVAAGRGCGSKVEIVALSSLFVLFRSSGPGHPSANQSGDDELGGRHGDVLRMEDGKRGGGQ